MSRFCFSIFFCSLLLFGITSVLLFYFQFFGRQSKILRGWGLGKNLGMCKQKFSSKLWKYREVPVFFFKKAFFPTKTRNFLLKSDFLNQFFCVVRWYFQRPFLFVRVCLFVSSSGREGHTESRNLKKKWEKNWKLVERDLKPKIRSAKRFNAIITIPV